MEEELQEAMRAKEQREQKALSPILACASRYETTSM